MRPEMRSLVRLTFAFVAFAALVLAGCGGSSEGSRDDALASLQLTTEAAGMQSEIGKLVGDLADEPSAKERGRIGRGFRALDRRATHLVATAREEAGAGLPGASGEIAAAGQALRAASLGLAIVAEDPLSGPAGPARGGARAEARAASRDLRRAVGIARAALAEGGELSDEGRRAVADSRRAVGRAERHTAASFGALKASVGRQRSEAASVEATSVAPPAAAEGGASGGCGTIQSEGATATIVIVSGSVDCAEATVVLQQYDDPSTPKEGSGGSASIGEWFCIHSSFGARDSGDSTLVNCSSPAGGEFESQLP